MRGTDVVVVGGGVVGCACARELAEQGMRVVLVERESLASGASGRNHGLLLTPLEPALAPMAKLALDSYLELAEGPPLPLELDREPIGFLVVGGTEREREDARGEAEAARGLGVSVDHLDAAALAGAEPELAGDLEEGWLLHDGRLVTLTPHVIYRSPRSLSRRGRASAR